MSDLDPGLVHQMRMLAASAPGLEVMTEAESNAVVAGLAERFGASGEAPWWWEALQAAPRDPVPEGGRRRLDRVAELLGQRPEAESRELQLLVTGGALPPWPCVQGFQLGLLGLLQRLPPFEFLLISPAGGWLVYAPHEDVLLVD